MNFDSTTYDQIEAYLNHSMDSNELTLFEQSLNSNPKLRDAVEIEKMANNVIMTSVEADLHKEVSQFRSKRKTTKISRDILLSILGLSAIIISIYSFRSKDSKLPEIDSNLKDPISNPIQAQEKEKVETTKDNNQNGHEHTKVNLTKPQSTTSNIALNENVDSELTDTPVISSEVGNEEILKTNDEPNVYQEVNSTSLEKMNTYKESESNKDLCATTKISISESKVASCQGESNGQIEIRATGGLKPYKFFIDDIEMNSTVDQLESKEYTITVLDANSCRVEKTVYLSEKKCFTPKQAFNPEYETWEYISYVGEFNIKIHDRAGNLVFKETGNQIEWNGQATNGSIVKSDSYLYIVYRNGSVVDKGYISVQF